MGLVLMFAAGFLVGVVITATFWYRKIIGTLRMTRDEYDGDVYMYVELDKPYTPAHKHVVMRVDRSRK